MILTEFKIIEELVNNEEIKKAKSKLDELKDEAKSSEFNKKLVVLYTKLEKADRRLKNESK